MFVPTFFVPLKTPDGEKAQREIDRDDRSAVGVFFTCWKYNMEFWRGGSKSSLKFSLGVPVLLQHAGQETVRPRNQVSTVAFCGHA